MRQILFSAVAFVALGAMASAAPVLSTSAGTFASAQVIDSSSFTLNSLANVEDSTTIRHVEISQTGRASAGYDFYRFCTTGGRVYLDIDNVLTNTNFNTEIGIWNATTGTLIATNNNVGAIDTGDNSVTGVGGTFNSRIRRVGANILAAGEYVVGVAAFNSGFQNGAPFITGAQIPIGGTYTLNISAHQCPEPSSLALLGAGIVLLGGVGWRRTRKA